MPAKDTWRQCVKASPWASSRASSYPPTMLDASSPCCSNGHSASAASTRCIRIAGSYLRKCGHSSTSCELPWGMVIVTRGGRRRSLFRGLHALKRAAPVLHRDQGVSDPSSLSKRHFDGFRASSCQHRRLPGRNDTPQISGQLAEVGNVDRRTVVQHVHAHLAEELEGR